MQQLDFSRRHYSQLVVSISANEPLADLGGGYIQDYYGTVSQVTLHDIQTDLRYEILITDNNPTYLEGYINLDIIPNGRYEFEGFLSDLVGNNTVIGDLQNPSLTGTDISVFLTIHPGLGVGAILTTSFPTSGLSFTLKLLENEIVNINMSLVKPTIYLRTQLLHDLNSIL